VTEYSTTAIWLTIVVIGLGTFALRFSLIALSGRADKIPDPLQRALRFIPPAVIAALVTPAFLMREGSIVVTFDNLRLFAGIVASVVAWKTKSILWTILSGMAALWILQAIA
jgi:branched-subunit amino acid transport protein